ncbi:MAG: hypothetical protein Q8M24_05045 [Pseudolabrys sp.]|nr:hypothetical protein [Pseudolabrys sp.]MDP2294812.1 hypothetical protein [Pseudolabrys sp.]
MVKHIDAEVDLQTAGAKRVAVIEIGSRATRLLVADVIRGQPLITVTTSVDDTRLMEAAALSEAAILHELDNIYGIVTRCRERAIRSNATAVKVFATEAIRQVRDTNAFRNSRLAASIDQILDEKAEANCSLISGLTALDRFKLGGDKILVIDQGAGSMELASGKRGPPVEMTEFSGVKLGGNLLLKLFRENGLDPKAYRAAALPMLKQCETLNRDLDRVIVQGTAATKFAWLLVRKSKMEKYDPKRVHGAKLHRKQLEFIVSNVETFSLDKNPKKKWADLQEFINPGEYGGDAAERVVAGIIPLIHLLTIFHKNEFVVSAYGTRHGMAWRLGQQSMA